MYFKDENNKPYQGRKEIFESKLGVNLTEITHEEFDQLVQEINTPTASQVLEQQLAEKRAYLVSTDWIGAKYHDEVTVNGTISKAEFTSKHEDIYNSRALAREFINQNEIKI